MSDEVLEAAISKALNSKLVRNRIQFLWHAGEPLLAGIDFYKRVIELVKQHNNNGIRVEHSIQTNATLIDDEWCMFFKEHDFKVGVSIDGPAFLHDAQRQNWANKPSHAKAMAGYSHLRKHNIRPGALCVLTKEALKYPELIMEFFASNGFTSLGFNPEEIENDNDSSSLNDEFDETIQLYRHFMSTVFDLQQTKYPQLRIREIVRVLRVLAHKRHHPDFVRVPPEIPPMSMLTIRRDGEISPYCPEFAGATSVEYDNFVIGNILVDELDNLASKPEFIRIRRDVDHSISLCAQECRYFDLCGSAPLSNKYSENGSLASTETQYCKLDHQILTDVIVEKALKI